MASVRTLSSTTDWVALPDLPAGELDILNSTGESLQLRYAAEDSLGQQITIPDGGSVTLSVVANAKEVEIKGTAGSTGVQLIVSP